MQHIEYLLNKIKHLEEETINWSKAVKVLEAERSEGWVPVSQRLPFRPESGWSAPVLAYVLAAPGSFGPSVVLARCDSSGNWHGKNFENGPEFWMEPLSWYPIPEPVWNENK